MRCNSFAFLTIVPNIICEAIKFMLMQPFYLPFNVFQIFDVFEPKQYYIMLFLIVFLIAMAHICQIIILTVIKYGLDSVSQETTQVKLIDKPPNIILVSKDIRKLFLYLFVVLILGFLVKILKIVVEAIAVSVSSLITHTIAFRKPISMDIKSTYTFKYFKIQVATTDKQILLYPNRINFEQFVLFFVVLMDILHHIPMVMILPHIESLKIISKQKNSNIITTKYALTLCDSPVETYVLGLNEFQPIVKMLKQHQIGFLFAIIVLFVKFNMEQYQMFGIFVIIDDRHNVVLVLALGLDNKRKATEKLTLLATKTDILFDVLTKSEEPNNVFVVSRKRKTFLCNMIVYSATTINKENNGHFAPGNNSIMCSNTK